MSEPSKHSGLTPDEQLVADALVEAWNRFMALEDAIPLDEHERFQRAIQDAKLVLMTRIARRFYPEYWDGDYGWHRRISVSLDADPERLASAVMEQINRNMRGKK